MTAILRHLMLFTICMLMAGQAMAAAKHDIRIVVDISGSLEITDPKSERSKALTEIVKKIPAGSQAGVWIFARYVNMIVPLAEVDDKWRQQGYQAANNLQARGNYTNITDAIIKAAAYWRKDEAYARNRNLILFTDGKVEVAANAAENAKAKAKILQTVLPQLKKHKVKVHTIALTDKADYKLLQQLADETGGYFVKLNQAAAIPQAFSAALKFALDSSSDDKTKVAENPQQLQQDNDKLAVAKSSSNTSGNEIAAKAVNDKTVSKKITTKVEKNASTVAFRPLSVVLSHPQNQDDAYKIDIKWQSPHYEIEDAKLIATISGETIDNQTVAVPKTSYDRWQLRLAVPHDKHDITIDFKVSGRNSANGLLKVASQQFNATLLPLLSLQPIELDSKNKNQLIADNTKAEDISKAEEQASFPKQTQEIAANIMSKIDEVHGNDLAPNDDKYKLPNVANAEDIKQISRTRNASLIKEDADSKKSGTIDKPEDKNASETTKEMAQKTQEAEAAAKTDKQEKTETSQPKAASDEKGADKKATVAKEKANPREDVKQESKINDDSMTATAKANAENKTTATTEKAAEAPKKKPKKSLVIILVVLINAILLLGAIVIYIIMRNKSSAKDDAITEDDFAENNSSKGKNQEKNKEKTKEKTKEENTKDNDIKDEAQDGNDDNSSDENKANKDDS